MPSATSASDVTRSTKSLTLPHSTFARISPVSYLASYLLAQPPTRPNGRMLDEFRIPVCNTSSLSHCIGSAVVRVGETAVVCGIQGEILRRQDVPNPPEDPLKRRETIPGYNVGNELEALNLLVPNVELATGCAPQSAYMPGGPPGQEAQSLSWKILRCAIELNLIDVEDLRIVRRRSKEATAGSGQEMEVDQSDEDLQDTVAYWTLYVSIHVLSLSGSCSLFDAVWASFLAALQDVRLPLAWWDADLETAICSDSISETKKLKIDGRPLACTWGVFHAPVNWQLQGLSNGEVQTSGEVEDSAHNEKSWILADPDGFEDYLCEESITVMVDTYHGTFVVRAVEKTGGMQLGKTNDIKPLLLASEDRWNEWNEVLPPR